MSDFDPTTVLLLGIPGSGKTVMAAKTAVHKPVFAIDTDRKMLAMAMLRSSIENNELFIRELKEPLSEEGLLQRVITLAKRGNEKTAGTAKPEGLQEFESILKAMLKDEDFKRSNTLLIDSFTQIGLHVERAIAFHAAVTAFEIREWGVMLRMMHDMTTALIDIAKNNGKDLILTVHERSIDVPGEDTRVEIKGPGNRAIIGMANIKTVAAISGQFGTQIGMHFNEVYGLEVVMDRSGNPTWQCRVRPDNKRGILRTSFPCEKNVYPPDFNIIWKGGEKKS